MGDSLARMTNIMYFMGVDFRNCNIVILVGNSATPDLDRPVKSVSSHQMSLTYFSF
jgi:hypothetical protein